MAISLKSLLSRSVTRPPIVLVYGVAGVGKTQLGQAAPAPIFLQTEDSQVDVPTFGLLRSYDQVVEAMQSLLTEDHDFKTVVLDSLDWLEPMVWAATCAQHKWADIETPGFGKGYIAAVEMWRGLLEGFQALRDERGMTTILIAHSEIKRFDSPETDPYDRYQPKLQKAASALIQERCDAVLFAQYRITTIKSDAGGFGKKAVRGVGAGDRLLYTAERPAFLAKNRFGLPDSIPLDWDALAAGIPYYNQTGEAA